jgi:hypothetical protein
LYDHVIDFNKLVTWIGGSSCEAEEAGEIESDGTAF